MESCPQCEGPASGDPENGLLWCWACCHFHVLTPPACDGLRLERHAHTRAPYSLRRH